jgi:PAS domain S-box-containing protein
MKSFKSFNCARWRAKADHWDIAERIVGAQFAGRATSARCAGKNMQNLARQNWFKRSAGLRYAAVTVGVFTAIIANLLLETSLQTSPTLFLFLCAIIFAAWFGGVGPGLAATALSILAFDYFFLPPIHSFDLMLSDMPRLSLFAMAALFVVGLIAAQRNTAESLWRSRADLEDKVRDLEKLNAALKIGETYLAEAQRLSRTGSFGWNVSSGEIIWSEENYRIFEYAPATGVTIETVLNRVHPDDATLVRQVISRATNHKEAFDFEHRLLMPDGSVKHLNVVAHPLIDEPGELRFVGAVMDITARKKSEEALRNSEQRYRHLFQHMPIALWQLNARNVVELFKDLRAEGVTDLGRYSDQHPDLVAHTMEGVKIEEVNQRMIEMLGARDANEVLGSLARFCHIHLDAFLRGLASRFRGEPMHQLETKIVTLDGRVIDVLLAATRPGLVEDPEISLVGLIDITEQVRAREMLQRVQADFAHTARVSMLGELTASIAHEVNQPLAAIITNGDACLRWLNRDVPQLHEVHDAVRLMINDSNRAAEVIRRVRAMAARQAPEQTLLSIDDVIREALTFLHHEVETHGLAVTLHTNAAAPKVLGDRTQLQQVIVNLTVNAIQAMTQAGTARRTLIIRTTLSEPNILGCTLEDSGPGINPNHLDHLFDSFFTTKDAGMGLGLAISRSIIEAHGGYIRADNASAHGGARFSFTLPAAHGMPDNI